MLKGGWDMPTLLARRVAQLEQVAPQLLRRAAGRRLHGRIDWESGRVEEGSRDDDNVTTGAFTVEPQCLTLLPVRTETTMTTPSFVVTRTGIVAQPSGDVFPNVHDGLLWDAVRRAAHAQYADIMELQSQRRYEISGVVTCDLDTGARVSLRTCEPSTAAAAAMLSSEPFCAARRRCTNGAEVGPGRHLLGEFHSHPVVDDDELVVDISVPSAADLYQLAVAAGAGVHNLTVILTPEGIYLCSVTATAYVRLRHDLQRFYDYYHYTAHHAARALGACRQPLTEYLPPDGSTPYLADLMTVPADLFDDLIRRADMKPKQKIARFCRTIQDRLGISIHFEPLPIPILRSDDATADDRPRKKRARAHERHRGRRGGPRRHPGD